MRTRVHPFRNSRALARRHRLLRVLALALVLVFANVVAAGAAAMTPKGSTHAHAATSHCHAATHAKQTQDGACPCCQHGCQCLHTTAAPLPEFLALPSITPAVVLEMIEGTLPPSPGLDRHLRPPIA